MDKGLGVIYNKLSNLFHPNTSTSPSANAPSFAAPERSISLPNTNLLDRSIPLSTVSTNMSPINNTYPNPSRASRQISIKTNESIASTQPAPVDTKRTSPIHTSKPLE